jgi:hypothetical protein
MRGTSLSRPRSMVPRTAGADISALQPTGHLGFALTECAFSSCTPRLEEAETEDGGCTE